MTSRREFLRWCSGVSALWLPSTYTAAPLFFGQEPDPQQQRRLSTPLEYRLAPNYPQGVPLDDVIRKIHPELDVFPTEKYAEEIEAILARWADALRQSPPNFEPLESSLSPELMASPLVASHVKEIRSGLPLEVWRFLFPSWREPYPAGVAPCLVPCTFHPLSESGLNHFLSIFLRRDRRGLLCQK